MTGTQQLKMTWFPRSDLIATSFFVLQIILVGKVQPEIQQFTTLNLITCLLSAILIRTEICNYNQEYAINHGTLKFLTGK